MLVYDASGERFNGVVNDRKRNSGHMVRVPNPGSRRLSSSQGHCAVFLGNTLNSHSASLHPGLYMGTGKSCAGG